MYLNTHIYIYIYIPIYPYISLFSPGKKNNKKNCFLGMNGLHMRATDAPIAANCIEFRCGSNGTSPGSYLFLSVIICFCLSFVPSFLMFFFLGGGGGGASCNVFAAPLRAPHRAELGPVYPHMFRVGLIAHSSTGFTALPQRPSPKNILYAFLNRGRVGWGVYRKYRYIYIYIYILGASSNLQLQRNH